MTTLDLLIDLRRRGVVLIAQEDLLHVEAPAGVLTADTRDALAAHRYELLRLLLAEDPGVAWRIEAMRPQVPAAGPIPYLDARVAAPWSGTCLSCGNPLADGQAYRCAPCAEAATTVARRRPDPVSGKPKQEDSNP